ncbi:unnamed protein product [Phaeothamnion confervicola]
MTMLAAAMSMTMPPTPPTLAPTADERATIWGAKRTALLLAASATPARRRQLFNTFNSIVETGGGEGGGQRKRAHHSRAAQRKRCIAVAATAAADRRMDGASRRARKEVCPFALINTLPAGKFPYSLGRGAFVQTDSPRPRNWSFPAAWRDLRGPACLLPRRGGGSQTGLGRGKRRVGDAAGPTN